AVLSGILLSTRKPRSGEDKKRCTDAERRLDPPFGVVRDRLTPTELQLPRAIVEQAPIAADSPFQQPLPRLVEGFDEIDLPVLGACGFHHAAQHQRLIGRRGERTVAHAALARPAHLADPDLLPGKNLRDLIPYLAHMRDGFRRR